jgi:hypothetical protein
MESVEEKLAVFYCQPTASLLPAMQEFWLIHNDATAVAARLQRARASTVTGQ